MDTKKIFYAAFVISPMLLLSGCNPLKWFTGDKTEKTSDMLGNDVLAGDWIVKIGGEVAVSPQEFQSDFNALLDEKPQLKAMLPLMPNLEQDFAKGLGNQKVVSRFIKDNKIDQKPEYLAKKERMMNAVQQMLNAEFFSEAFPSLAMSDADAKKFYEENKDSLQGALISQGGISISGVSFDTKADAENFLKKVKEVKNLDLQKVAQDSKLSDSFRDFNMVNNQSFGVDPVLRSKILALKKFPTTDILAIGDKAFWVVHATEKTDSQYRPFEEVKDGVKNVAQQTEKAKQLQAELEKLMQKYNVEINEEYFRQKVAKANAEAAAFEALQKQQIAAQNDEPEAQHIPASKAA